MRLPSQIAICILFLASVSYVSAAELIDMVGRWKWQNFTIEVRECSGTGICSKVVAGPKNVGMEIFASRMVSKKGDWYGSIKHSESGEIYNTRMRQSDENRWRLDGCTQANVCLSGELVRLK